MTAQNIVKQSGFVSALHKFSKAKATLRQDFQDAAKLDTPSKWGGKDEI